MQTQQAIYRSSASAVVFLSILLGACGGGNTDTAASSEVSTSSDAPSAVVSNENNSSVGSGDTLSPAEVAPNPVDAKLGDGPAAGYAAGSCAVPAAAQVVNTATFDHVVGTGTAASCTSDAVVNAVAQGGVITFNCGPNPVVINMTRTAKVFNNKPNVVLDGGGKVTLSGGGRVRILYQNTCDAAQVYTSTRCDLQSTPSLTVQNITMVDGNSAGQNYGVNNVEGGGAIYAGGGQLKIVNSRFFRNQCESTGPDMGGAAVRARGTVGPVYVVKSTFGGAAGYGNQCSNGGGLSGLAASFSVMNSVFTHNKATGVGANPAKPGTPGGGSGGAIYQDGNTFDLSVCGSSIQNNSANEGGGAVFYVSNNRTGSMSVNQSVFKANLSGQFETTGLPGIFVLAAPGQPVVTQSTLQK
jgi:hypothetical protein